MLIILLFFNLKIIKRILKSETEFININSINSNNSKFDIAFEVMIT